MRLLRRRRSIPVRRFEAVTGSWADCTSTGVLDRDELTVATYNTWFDNLHAEQRYLAIASHLEEVAPDVVALQEVTPQSLDVFLSRPWVRADYVCASVVGGAAGNYGLLLLSRVPVARVTYSRLPTRQSRGFLEAEILLNGGRLIVCDLHLDSGKASARWRVRQLRRLFRTLDNHRDVVAMGDFNMRDAENAAIPSRYRDVWPTLRPDEDGFTEDTSINLMRFDMKNKHRQVRFDRVLVKGNAWRATSIDLLGKAPISPSLPRIFPSDHFGVACRLERQRQVTGKGRPKH